jgi:hypothetical protein
MEAKCLEKGTDGLAVSIESFIALLVSVYADKEEQDKISTLMRSHHAEPQKLWNSIRVVIKERITRTVIAKRA